MSGESTRRFNRYTDDVVMSAAASILVRPANDEAAARRRRKDLAAAAFPNDKGNYRRKEASTRTVIQPLTPRQRFIKLVSLYPMSFKTLEEKRAETLHW